MSQSEFFNNQNPTTAALNLRRDQLYDTSHDMSHDAAVGMQADYIRDLTDAGDIQAFKYAIHKGLNPLKDNISRLNPSGDVHQAILKLTANAPEYGDKIDTLLTRLIDLKELPPLDPNDDSDSHHTEQYEYRFYMTHLFSLVSTRPRSSQLFEASCALLTSGDPRIYGKDTYLSRPFTTNLIYRMLKNHQTDRRMQSTWEAALKRENCNDPDCFYPEPMDISFNQAFTGMIKLPAVEGEEWPFDIIIPAVEMLLKAAEGTDQATRNRLSISVRSLFFNMNPSDKAKTKTMLQSHFQDNALLQSMLAEINIDATSE